MATKKKKRTSKHVLESRPKKLLKVDNGSSGNDSTTPTASEGTPLSTLSSGPNKPRKASRHVKDPEEAREYLVSWKKSFDGESASTPSTVPFKFKKNVQSWLIRHMYEIDVVNKGTFGMLMDYLKGLKGETTIQRMKDDATRRARRYKLWEEHKDEQPASSPTSTLERSKDDSNDGDEMIGDDQRFAKLDAHDKRKEYKRARKVLDLCELLLSPS